MSRATAPHTRRIPSVAFAVAEEVGLTLPGVVVATKYDGSPLLKLGGCFMAGLATHATAEPDTLVVRMSPDDRALLIADAPDTYYVTDYHLSTRSCSCGCRVSIETPFATSSRCRGA